MANLLQGIGQAQPVTQFLDQALKMRQSENMNQLAQMQMQEHTMRLQKLQEESAYNKSPYNMNFDPLLTTYEPGTPEHDQFKKQLFAMTGADEYGNTTNFKRNMGIQTLTKNHEVMKGIFDARMGVIRNQYITTMQQLDKAKADGDLEKIKKLQATADNLAKRGVAASSKWVEYQIAADKEKQSEPLEKVETPTGPTLVPRSQAAGMTPHEPGPKEPTSPDSAWLASWDKDNPDATPKQRMAAIEKYNKQKMESRIPAFNVATGLPPGYVFNRRTGNYEWKGEGPAPGMTPGEVATYGADKKSLENITKGTDTIMAFEKGVQNSLTLVDNLSDKMQRTKIPGVNKLSQYIQYNAGDPTVKAFKNAVTTAMTEYMKVTTAGTGISVQELTQGAQQRAKELLEISDNPASVKAAIAVMRQEMGIKKRAFAQQKAEILARLNKIPTTEPTPSPTPSDISPEDALAELRRRGIIK